MLTPKAVTWLIFLLLGLLAIVVAAGIVQNRLDPTGVAVALISMMTGIAGGAILRSRNEKDGDSK